MRHAVWAILGLVLLAGGGTLLPSSVIWAQEEQPAAPADDAAAAAAEEAPAPAPPPRLDQWNDAHSIPRSKVSAVYWVKLFLIWLLFVTWVKSGDWINCDSQIFNLGYGTWNPAIFFPFAAVLVFFTFPITIIGVCYFWLAFGLLWLAYGSAINVSMSNLRIVGGDVSQQGGGIRCYYAVAL